MHIEILDTKQVNGNTWALCKGNLLHYLQGLKTDFFEFSVQRKIVNNVYLDGIYRSVEKGEPFPPVTLTYSGSIPPETRGAFEIDKCQIEILDGLQRTYRLWVILFIVKVIEKSGAKDLLSLAEAIKNTDDGEVILQNKFITPKFIKSLLVEKDGKLYIEYLVECYSKFEVYFTIWTGLDDQEVIRRMLILNAGQKSVSSTHQFELLFLHFFEDGKLHYKQEVTLVREKDVRFRAVQQGKRELGEYLMSSVVVALQSFINGKQLRIATANKINLDDNKLLNDEALADYFNPDTLSDFINQLYDFGEMLSKKDSKYIKWYGKDTVLSGIFGAMGAFMIDNGMKPQVETIGDLSLVLSGFDDPFNLKDYYNAYENKLASTKVNVGNAVRKAIFNYTKDMLTLGSSNWYKYFTQHTDYDEE